MNLCDIMYIGCDNVQKYNNKVEKDNGILSATRPRESVLKTGLETNSKLLTKMKQKSIIKIYTDENKYYVEHSTAYVLGLINTRAIMLDSPKLIEISNTVYNRLKDNDFVEIEYIKIEKKSVLKVYVDGSNYCIDNSAAYALGLLGVEEFNNRDNNYYYITEEVLNGLKTNFDIQFNSLSLEKNTSDKKL